MGIIQGGQFYMIFLGYAHLIMSDDFWKQNQNLIVFHLFSGYCKE